MRTALISLLLVLLPLNAMADQAPLPDRRVVLRENTDMPGGDLAPLFNASVEACVATCLADAGCVALTYNHRSRACFPKAAASGPVPFVGASSGLMAVTPPQAQAVARAKVAGASKWLTPEDVDAARRQAAGLGGLYPAPKDADTARDNARDAAARNDTPETTRWMGAVTAQTDAPQDWLSLAQWMGAEGHDGDMTGAAMSAAINAWLRDPGPATAAVRLWADLAERRDRGRDGLNALRMAAAADTDPDLAKQLAGFEERHGFRTAETRVEADGPTPRACVVMSEEVARDRDLTPFVALPDPALAVEASGWEVCVTGIAHGSPLKLTLRAGLPAASGETLRRDVPLTLYVRDRSPQVRFSGRAYVLPATGDQGLTMQTVNASSVALTLYRMSDRNLVRALRSGIFGTPVVAWKEDVFTSELGEAIWRGTADVAPLAGGAAPAVNTEAATRIDIAAAAGLLQPGIYALSARVPDLPDERSPPATQWFMVSDLGLTSFSGSDGLTVAVRALSDATARPGVEVALVSRGNAILGTVLTDAQGVARFDAGLTRGRDAAAPAMVTATVRDGATVRDQAFLSLLDPEFDLSDRGVEGNPPSPPVDLFMATDRGAYRADETVHATILARDDRAGAIDGLPLTAVILRPDGVEHARMMPAPAGAGGFVLDFDLPGTAPRGAWRIDLRLEETGPPLATARILVEDFRPERIDVTLSSDDAPVPASAGSLGVSLDARWLFGAPGTDLPVEGEMLLTPARSLPGWEGYVFGRQDTPPGGDYVALPTGRTDAGGHYAADVPLPPALAEAPQPVEAKLTWSIREGAGRPVSRSQTRLILPPRAALGAKPGFPDATVAEGAEAAFDIVALGPDLVPRPAEVGWVLNRVDTDYQWFALDGEWSWQPVTRRSRTAEGVLPLDAAPHRLSIPVSWGEYELVLTSADGAATSTTFAAGWGAATGGTDTPDRLKVTLDKPAYRAGDSARVTIDATSDGVALVSVLSNRLVSLQTIALKSGANSLQLPVTDEWGAGVYVAVSAIRPLDAATAADHAPIRAIGIVPAGVDASERRLSATLAAPAGTTPRGELRVRLAVQGAATGETVHATLAAVDQGILNLTRMEPPDPSAHYFGQRRLGVGLRDLYGRLILPSGATDGAVRAGGDAGAGALQAPPPTERLMAFFSGPLTLGPEGAVEVPVPLPDFNGEVRLMAVVWSATALGQADATVLVRDPVVMTVTAPAFLAPGDTALAEIALTHTSGAAGDVALVAEPTGDDVTLSLGALPDAVALAENARAAVPLALTAPQDEGLANLRLSATLPDGQVVTKDLVLTITRQDPQITRAARMTLAPGASGTLDPATLGAFRPGGHATLTTGAFAQLDLGAAVTRLQTYPYGCTEQLASGLLPPLASAIVLPRQVSTEAVDQAIAQILTRQSGSGGFGLWDADAGDPWLDAYVTDVLARARASGHAVPEAALTRAFANLQNTLNGAVEPQYAAPHEAAAMAYAAYVLAREGRAVVSDLRYYVDTATEAFSTPLAAAQLGAALAAVGDVGRADRMFARAGTLMAAPPPEQPGFRLDYGTPLRDRAGVLALAAEAGSAAIGQSATATAISAELAQRGDAALSTQEAGWIVLAGDALLTARPPAPLSLNGTPLDGAITDLGDPASLVPLVLANPSDGPVDATLSVTGVPMQAPPAGGTAYRITRAWVTPEGQAVDPATVARGTRMIATLEVTPLPGFGEGGRLIVTDPLPAGVEIDNPNLVAAGEITGLDQPGGLAETDMVEFRQDRFAAAVTWTSDQPFRLAYRVRAVTPGTYARPAATVEDMYRPERRGWTDSGPVEITR